MSCGWWSHVSAFFGWVSLASWMCAQLPQIYANYRSKSAVGISPSFLLLWFMGDFLSFTSCVLSDVVLKFQVYLSLFFICNDVTLCYQYYYYYSVYPHRSAQAPALPQPDGVSVARDYNAHVTNSIKIHLTHLTPHEADKNRPIAEYLSSSGSPTGSYSSTDAKKVALGAVAAMGLPVAQAATTSTAAVLHRALGLVLAWMCTVVYILSRCPQLYKNYRRKSVEGISALLFGLALLGNLTYTLSILTSCSFVAGDSRVAFLLKELPYILGSSGTIVFDVAYFYQRWLYRLNGRDTLVMELEDEQWA